MVVYLDGVIGLNFLVDFVLLLGVNRLSGHPPGLGRAAAAAVVGGGYAGACMAPALTFLSSGLWRSVSLGVMSMTAFGLNRSAVRRGVLFVLLSMAMGGLVMCFDTGNFLGLLFCAVALVLLCQMGFRGKAIPQRLVPVTIRHQGKEVKLLALQDTGNTLRDPVTGEQVLVADSNAAYRLAGLTPQELADPVAAVSNAKGSGLRLIPYHAVGTAGGMLLAMHCDSVEIGKNFGRNLVAFSPQAFPSGEYQALTGGYYG